MIDGERFKRLFPHLAKELEKGESKINIDQFRIRAEHEDRLTGRRWGGHNPDIVDFIRRCDTPEQAEEIISYMEGQGEIPAERAAELRRRLRAEGLSGFGDKKETGFYHRED